MAKTSPSHEQLAVVRSGTLGSGCTSVQVAAVPQMPSPSEQFISRTVSLNTEKVAEGHAAGTTTRRPSTFSGFVKVLSMLISAVLGSSSQEGSSVSSSDRKSVAASAVNEIHAGTCGEPQLWSVVLRRARVPLGK